MNKEQEILKYSNPKKVKEIANDIFADTPFQLELSTRKNKKYMITGDFTNNRWIHFGRMNYEDFTKHKDHFRRNNFANRNRAWRNMPINTPAFLSYNLLW